MFARNALSTAGRKIRISGVSVSPIRSSVLQLPARLLSLFGAGVTGVRCADFPNVLRTGKVCFDRAAVSIPCQRLLRTTACLNDEVRTVNTPPFADSISEGDVRWHKAVGDQIKEDDIVCEIETDKTAIPCPSQVSGVIEELLVKDGEKVTKGTALYKIRVGATAGKGAAADKGKEKAEPQQKEVKEEKKDKPATEEKPKRADEQKEKGGDDAQSGAIPTKLPKVPAPPKEPLKSKPTSSVPVTPSAPAKTGAISGSRSEHREKMNRMRLRIAERLKEAQNTAAMLTTFNEVDMSNIIEMRNKYKDVFMKKHGVKLGFMSPFIKAAAYALQDQPVVNAVIDGTDILHRDYIDISVAVASPKGLVVPVLRNVEDMSYADIELTLEGLSGKARDGKLAIEDMTGGTFTISNGGVFGSLFGTPIINPPQSAILGMHATNDRPVAVNGQVVIRPMMFVALTYDHRLIDGREAVTFLKKIKQVIEDPRVLLLDL